MKLREWFKSAITGWFMTHKEAEASPATTIKQTMATEECDRPCAAEACTEVAPKPKRTAAQRASKRKPRKPHATH
jgi:hypothetical protein